MQYVKNDIWDFIFIVVDVSVVAHDIVDNDGDVNDDNNDDDHNNDDDDDDNDDDDDDADETG
ncbi:hypothetical protein DPMN_191018 [Dreissena polymorpha]|uniref:Uncharacterized protein n=1 Tax=Dreissena polymorpha TaxID=45954 RepID=A0A9D3Y3E8_DREPO|nr:hypothetical protein DPMN_191018 [Dreissena polymorpha]